MSTVGEYRVGIDFNPGGNPKVTKLKTLAAEFIDTCRELRDPNSEGEVARLWALAETHMEDAAMWAVKAVTKPKMSEG